jgi:hypothetical protein
MVDVVATTGVPVAVGEPPEVDDETPAIANEQISRTSF